ncbi:MAG: 50S ribosomal protein L25/general stress protein Ctc [Sphingopyxis sp.]
MSDQLTLSAELRSGAGKGASRALRNNGRVPAVIYGGNTEPTIIHVEEKALVRALMTGHFFNSVVDLDIDGKHHTTLPKDVAFHPVNDRPLHVDFFRVSKDTKLTVDVPVVFINEDLSPGLKKGGVLNIVRHEVELACDASHIPEQLEIDMTGYEVGDSVHISAVKLPAGAVPTITDRDFTIATVVAPSALKSSGGDTTKAEGEAEATGE